MVADIANVSKVEWDAVVANIASLTSSLYALNDEVAAQESELQASEEARLNFWLLVAAFNILLMQAGFALLELGTVQAKNAKSILFKNMVDMCTGIILWWIIGYEFSRSGILSFQVQNMGHIDGQDAVFFFHSFTYSTTCATIISGGVAERISFSSYMVLAAVMVGFFYPVIAYWTWGDGGWLAHLGFTDFAGAGAIHALGGFSTLVTASKLGPRIGRFLKDPETGQIEVHPIKGHSPVLASVGVFILLFGWFSFNASSTLGADTEHFRLSSRAAINTILSAATASIFAIVWRQKESGVHDLEAVHNTMLCGAVAITGCCAYVDFWVAPLVGIFSTIGYYFASRISMNFYIDDPLDAFAVHGGGGVMGVLCTGLFANPAYLDNGRLGGFLLTGRFHLLGAQLLGLVVIFAWGFLLFGVAVYLIDKTPWFGLRVEKDAELLGLDFAYHDGFAYPDFNKHNVITFNEMKAAERRVEARNRGKKTEIKKVNDLGAALKRDKKKHKRKVDKNGVSYTGSTYSGSATKSTSNTQTLSKTQTSLLGSSCENKQKSAPLAATGDDSPQKNNHPRSSIPGADKPWKKGNAVAPASPASTSGTAKQTWRKEVELRGEAESTPKTGSSSPACNKNKFFSRASLPPSKHLCEEGQTMPAHTHPRAQELCTSSKQQESTGPESPQTPASVTGSEAPLLENFFGGGVEQGERKEDQQLDNSGGRKEGGTQQQVVNCTKFEDDENPLPGTPNGRPPSFEGQIPLDCSPRNVMLPPVRRRSSGGRLLPLRRLSSG